MGNRYVVTEHASDNIYDFCHGVYDDNYVALGHVLDSIITKMEDGENEEVCLRYDWDDCNGDWFDITLREPKNKNHSELKSIFRVYVLNDKEENKNDT